MHQDWLQPKLTSFQWLLDISVSSSSLRGTMTSHSMQTEVRRRDLQHYGVEFLRVVHTKKLKNNDYSQTAFLKNKGGIYRCQLQETDQSSRWENWHHNIHSMAHWLSSNHLWSMETDHSNLLLGSMLLCCNAETKNHFIPKHTHTRLTALCPGLPRWASTRKVKTIWILLKQETVGGSGISWAIMQVCISLQTDNHTSTPPLSFLQA